MIIYSSLEYLEMNANCLLKINISTEDYGMDKSIPTLHCCEVMFLSYQDCGGSLSCDAWNITSFPFQVTQRTDSMDKKDKPHIISTAVNNWTSITMMFILWWYQWLFYWFFYLISLLNNSIKESFPELSQQSKSMSTS